MTIPLPIPSYSPNKHLHWARAAKLKKSLRTLSFQVTLQLLGGEPRPRPVAYTLRYYWPRMRRDDDNAIASVKPYMDGICDALRMDDRHLRFRALEHHRGRGKGRLEIVMHMAGETP